MAEGAIGRAIGTVAVDHRAFGAVEHAERPGYHWTNDRWEHGPHGYYHVPGRWDRAQASRDRDHDGVPNAYDRHPDNPYRR